MERRPALRLSARADTLPVSIPHFLTTDRGPELPAQDSATPITARDIRRALSATTQFLTSGITITAITTTERTHRTTRLKKSTTVAPRPLTNEAQDTCRAPLSPR